MVCFVPLAEPADPERVLGWVAQFWKLAASSPRITNPQRFLEFDRPDYAKATLNFCLTELPHHTGVRLTTETRVYATDPIARKKFAVDWRLIRGVGARVRREWLRAIGGGGEAQRAPGR